MPNLSTLEVGKFTATEAMNRVVVSTQVKILSGITGTIILVYDEPSAFELVRMCCPQDGQAQGSLTEMGFSALKEVGNVVMGAFAAALSVILRQPVIPSIPFLANGPLSEVIHSAAAVYGGKDYIITVEACFEEADKRVKGSLYFVIPAKTLKEIQSACRKMLKQI
jgi:chemotaxis protein CheC